MKEREREREGQCKCNLSHLSKALPFSFSLSSLYELQYNAAATSGHVGIGLMSLGETLKLVGFGNVSMLLDIIWDPFRIGRISEAHSA